MAVGDAIRHELMVLARRPRARVVEFTRKRPCDWRPHTVSNPSSRLDSTFTDVSAWEFIADQLDAGHELEEVTLEHPPGKVGYVMKVQIEVGVPRVYIKLELGSGAVFGRSFHYCQYDEAL